MWQSCDNFSDKNQLMKLKICYSMLKRIWKYPKMFMKLESILKKVKIDTWYRFARHYFPIFNVATYLYLDSKEMNEVRNS